MDDYQMGTLVYHVRFGSGTVEFNKGKTALVRFENGIEECLTDELVKLRGIREAVVSASYDNLRELVARCQAAAIRSINDNWGVFSKSRIALLPHQLWVCHKVLSEWPINKLIADDVGLGKTIEAGLILWPLLAKKKVRRLLVLTPASLVEQWQERLRLMFDIRLSIYNAGSDTKRSDYWNTQNLVVASLPTLRKDVDGRHERMLEAEDWDLLIVDEAHHLNALEAEGATLGYRFVQKLIEHNKFKSRMFFTATPHRGKDYGFFALLRLLDDEKFNPKKSAQEQQDAVSQIVIRNNKQCVTDMDGVPLFKPVKVTSKTYCFSPEEQNFYDKLTKFIVTGQMYASSLGSTNQRAVQLVLIAMQKLAASSVAAIRSAIQGRIERLSGNKARLLELTEELNIYSQYEKEGAVPELDDAYIALEEEYAATSVKVMLMENEQPMLQELLELADKVNEETKINTLLEVLFKEFKDRSVVFFTEYKATQTLLVNTLHQHFGHGCVSFINGDKKLKNIIDESGTIYTWNMDRYDAAEKFSKGEVRFIVCTEAGGEGIDLQDNCHSMIHVDLPWNPMRLHQRVGRLNRYGQKYGVEVMTLRNPDTVEARIWGLLNDKIEKVMRSLGSAMDEPEDLLQLILGMTDAKIFNELFSGGVNKSEAGLQKWFDAKAGTFGGSSAVSTVKNLIGHADKFEYKNLEEVPRLDLKDMSCFFESMLKINGHRLDMVDGKLSFITPKEWRNKYGIKRRYDNVVFDRSVKDQSVDVLGIGHPIMENALTQAESFSACFAVAKGIDAPILIYQIKDQLTGEQTNVDSFLVAIDFTNNNQTYLLKDDELMFKLASIYDAMPKSKDVLLESSFELNMETYVVKGEQLLSKEIGTLGTAYRLPTFELFAAFVPV
ncbi:MAG: DEAD/DEAH box helicase family protein [Colwellia sp.]|nr:DEAD/DEAH box helicase family protein [Colwellia sp.]